MPIWAPLMMSNTLTFIVHPLLARPKDGNKRRVILNLSHPTGTSLNDTVTRDSFDIKGFTLRFPTIDDIVDNIGQTGGLVILSKVFRNLKVDSLNTFKFGIKRKSKFYLDVAMEFGWVHHSVSFQMTSDKILHMMRQEDCSVSVYIDHSGPPDKISPHQDPYKSS